MRLKKSKNPAMVSIFRHATLALLLQLAALSAFAASPIRLTLALDPPETLPGIPVSVRIEALNTSSSPAAMPKAMVLEVTPEHGEPYLTAMGMGRQGRFALPFYETDGSTAIVPGSGSRRFDFRAGPDSPPWRYGRFWREPGVYRLRVIADNGLTVPLSGNVIPPDSELLIDPVVSNSAMLTIVTPSGVDLQVWKMIAERDDPFSFDALADAVWQAYPNSSYAPYMIRSAAGDTAKQVEYFAAALAKNPRGAFGDSYRVSMARGYYSMGEGALPTDVPRAFEYSEAARRLLEEVIRRNVEPQLVQTAKEELAKWGASLDELNDYAARMKNPDRPYCERLVVFHVSDSINRIVTNDLSMPKPARDKLGDVLQHTEKFATEIAKTPPSMSSALASLKVAIMSLDAALDDKLIDPALHLRWAGTLVGAAKVAAQKAIDAAARDAHVDVAKLASARAKFQEAQAMIDDKDLKGAANRFKDALNDAQEASKARPDPC